MSRRTQTALAFAIVVVAGVLAAGLAAREAGQAAGKSAGRAAGETAGKIAAVRLRESQVAGCARSRDDREDAIRGWTAARTARLTTSRNRALPVRERIAAGAAAETYRIVIEGYHSRIVDCSTAFPPISP